MKYPPIRAARERRNANTWFIVISDLLRLLAGFGASTGALQADGSHLVEPTFPAAEAARAFAYAASLPPSAVVDQLTVTAAGMPFAGRG